MNTDRSPVTMAQIAESDRIVREADVIFGIRTPGATKRIRECVRYYVGQAASWPFYGRASAALALSALIIVVVVVAT